MSQLARLQEFVAREVRYVALEHGASAVVPRRAGDTLESRYGDCKDKVTLLLALARGAGYQAWPVLVGSTRRDLERLRPPALGYFDHMIACVRAPDGAQHCFDPTVAEAGFAELPEGLHGAVALDLRDGVRAPRQLAAAPYAFEVRIEGRYALTCDGSIEETLERRFSGPLAMDLRGMLRALSERDRLRWAEDEYRRTASEAASPTFGFDALASPSLPLAIRSTWAFPPAAPFEASDRYEDLDPWLVSYARGMKSENRHHPYPMRGLHLRSRLAYELCEGFEVRASGAELDMRSEFGFLVRRYERQAGGVQVVTEVDIPRRTLEPSEIERFNRFVERSLEQTRIRFRVGRPLR